MLKSCVEPGDEGSASYISHEWFSGCHGDFSLHAVRHVDQEGLSLRSLVPHPEVVKEVHDPLLHQ